MGRSKRGKKASKGSQEEDWDDNASVLSVASNESSFTQGQGDQFSTYEENPLEYITEALYEKRTATRESALEGLIQYLRSSYRLEECESWKETLCQRLLGSLKKGKAKEVQLASTAVALIVVTLGADAWTETTVLEFLPLLKQKMTSGASAGAKVAAIRALGVLCFVGSEDSTVLQECIEKVQKLFTASSSDVRSEAYTILALLMSISIPIGNKIVDYMLLYVEHFTKALGDESLEVRTAAGNALVVVNEIFGDMLDNNDEENGGGSGGGGGGRNLDEEIVEKMNQLATSSWSNEGVNTRMNKKDKANQRRAFRDLVDAMDGKSPNSKDSKIKLKHGDVLVLDTQSLKVTASVFKSLLAQGFQVHLQNNYLLHQIFNFQPRQEKIHLSQLEKKMMFSPNSAAKKSATKERNRDRRQRGAAKLDFYECD